MAPRRPLSPHRVKKIKRKGFPADAEFQFETWLDGLMEDYDITAEKQRLKLNKEKVLDRLVDVIADYRDDEPAEEIVEPA